MFYNRAQNFVGVRAQNFAAERSDSQNQPSCSTKIDEAEDHRLCDPQHEQQIDNSNTVLEKIANLYADRLLSDITLEVGGNKYAAHRLILCASSDVFQVMLMNPNWNESQETNICLQEESECGRVFPDFLKYLYTGKLHINHFLVLPLLTLADKYNVKDLIHLCVDYMCRHVVSATRHTQLIQWLQYTLNCGHAQVHQACSSFITWNFQLVAETEDFKSLETDVLIHFLQKSDLVIKDEVSVFHSVSFWLKCQEKKIQMHHSPEDARQIFRQLVLEVMSHIRFPMMSQRDIPRLLLDPLLKRFPEFFFDRMGLCMAFQSNKHDHIILAELQKDSGHLLFTPRLYTTEIWSSSLIIDNYPTLPIYGVRTLVFNTPMSFRECNTNHFYEWMIDIYPKGVWFKKYYLIVWQGMLEVPESVSKTVRFSLTQKDFDCPARVSVGILICGQQDGVEHVRKVVRRNCVFTPEERTVNLNDLVPYEDLNDLRVGRSPFLTGPNADCLKLQVVITPLSDF